MSRHKFVKELRLGPGGRGEVRILFAFNLWRHAPLLAGDKQGRWDKWYRTNIRIADDRYDKHLDNLNKQKERH